MSYIGVPPLTKAERNVIDHNVIDGQSTYQASYTPGFLDVYLNGVLLQSDEYQATSGVDFTLGSPTGALDTLTTVAWGTFETASVAPNSVGEQALDVRGLQVAGLLPTAWCTFDGTLTGTNSPLDGYNVASVTRVSAGNYEINFETPMDNGNYSTLVSSNWFNNTTNSSTEDVNKAVVLTADNTFNLSDATRVKVHIFGALT